VPVAALGVCPVAAGTLVPDEPEDVKVSERADLRRILRA